MDLKTLPRFGIIQRTICVIAIFMMSVVWPMGFFTVDEVSDCDTDNLQLSGPSNAEGFVLQEFSPMFNKLQSILIYVTNEAESIESLKGALRLYDYQGNCLVDTTFQLADYEFPGFVEIPLNVELTPGMLYRVILLGMDDNLFLGYVEDEGKTPENGAMFYKEVPASGKTLAMGYSYERPMGLKRILITDVAIAVVTAFVLFLFLRIKSLTGKQVWSKVEICVKYICYGVFGGVCIFLFYFIFIARGITDSLLNNIVLFLGFIFILGFLSWRVYRCPSEDKPFSEKEETLQNKLIHFVRSLLFAATIIFACMHTNAMTDYEKGLHIRLMLTCICLIVVSYSKKREIWNVPNVCWTICAILFGKWYVTQNNDHIEHISTAIRSSYLIWGMGLVLINLFYSIRSGSLKKLNKIYVPYLAVWCVLWISFIIFSNGREWPLIFFVVFLILIFKYFTGNNSEQMMNDFLLGAVLAFAGSTLFSIYRRPYQYFMLTRYSGIFYTATATSLYLLLPICAALAKALEGIKKGKIGDYSWYFVMAGVSIAFSCFTASRTGLFACGAVFVFFFYAFIWKKHKRKFKQMLLYVSIVAAMIIMTYLSSYSLARVIPGMVGNPFYFFFEQEYAYIQPDTGLKGDDYEHKYITIERNLEMLFGRLFAPQEAEGTSDSASGYKINEQNLIASIGTNIPVSNLEEGDRNYSNGRLDIYKKYIKEWNLTGHEDMGITDENGEYIIHAHNTYLQTIHDFGLIVGGIFLLVCFIAFLRSLRYAYLNEDNKINAFLPLFMIVAFGVSSLVEWVFFPCIPLGFAFIMMQIPLMRKGVKKNEYK